VFASGGNKLVKNGKGMEYENLNDLVE